MKIIVTCDKIFGAGLLTPTLPWRVALIQEQGRAGWVTLAYKEFETKAQAISFAEYLPKENETANYKQVIRMLCSEHPDDLKKRFVQVARTLVLLEEQEFAIINGELVARYWCTKRRGEIVSRY